MPEPMPQEILLKQDLRKSSWLETRDSIPLELPEEIGVPWRFPDEIPPMELVYGGAPIEVKITMDEILDREADGRNCVMILPCPTK